jgi:hypothetical protein
MRLALTLREPNKAEQARVRRGDALASLTGGRASSFYRYDACRLAGLRHNDMPAANTCLYRSPPRRVWQILLKGLGMNVSRMKTAMDNELAAAGATDEQIARYGALWNGSAEKSGRDGNPPCPVCFLKGNAGHLTAQPDDDHKEHAACPVCGEHFYWPAE